MVIPQSVVDSNVRSWKRAYSKYLDEKIDDELNDLFVMWVVTLYALSDIIKPDKSEVVRTIFELSIDTPKAPMFLSQQEIESSLARIYRFGFNDTLLHECQSS